MKILKSLAVAAAATGLTASAFAQTKVYITGAPALRTELTTAIENLVRGQTGVTRAHNGTSLITANVAQWRGATIGGQTNVTIKLTYNGSAAGWLGNAGNKQERFLNDTNSGPNAVDVLTDRTAPAETARPDFHISNEFQASTPWNGNNNISFPERGSTAYQQLLDPVVGILPLRLVASPAAPAGLNLTPQLARQLYVDGELRLSQLTGNPADHNKKVYALSRGIDSGIRTLWSAANSVGTTTPIKTYQATTADTANKPVVGVTIVSPGVGYTSAPIVEIAAPETPGSVTALATATVANGKITGFTVTRPGSGYNTPPRVTLRGGGGSLASARAVIRGGRVVGHKLWDAATTPASGSGASAVANQSLGRIQSIRITNPGSGYTTPPPVRISGGGGSGATATAVVSAGRITAINVTAQGSGYTGNPTITIGQSPDNRILGINTPLGNGGYATFGPLLTAITSTLNLPGGNPGDIYLTVLGESDAISAIQGGAKEVKWNGNTLGTLGTYGNTGTVTASSAPAPSTVGSATPSLAFGQYDLWGYVRLPFLESVLPRGSVKRAVHTAIANQLRDFDAPVKLRDVNVRRTADGGTLPLGRRLE